ncbi:MAG: toprim domain-containing protein, partial [Rhodocyclales bacterium]|nr:toprim domain-containing protein [Rhodocyclales bacterium]
MQADIHREVLSNLNRDFEFKPAAKGWLRQGKCPSCSKKELYTNEEHPWVIRCGRLDKCGAEFHVKELYPEIFESWSERHPPTPQNPNAAADAYLQYGRGFDLAKIKGWYTQESYFDRESKEGSATVRFALGGAVWWERIIDKPGRFGKRKATFRGEYGGTWWQPPTGIGAPKEAPSGGTPKELWIVEGIFDAIALLHHNLAAVAALSCNNYPALSLKGLAEQCAAAGTDRPTLVWALDGDDAGRRFARKHCEQSRKDGWSAIAAVIPQTGRGKLDWNDMHQRGRLTQEALKEYRYEGSLLMASSASEKGNLMYSRHGWATFPFDFDNRIWWWKTDLDAFAKAQDKLSEENPKLGKEELRAEAIKSSHTVSEICNCRPEPLYYLKNEVTDEAWYYFRVDFPHDGASVKTAFTAGQLSATAEFKKRLLHAGAGAIWSGNAGHLDRLLSRWTFNIKKVETVDFIGYSI